MRRELAAAAMELFATKGYEATTVDEIAAAAGVARRTFFRHFRSKEEAIFPDHDDTLVRAEAVLNAAPAHEHPLDTVCRGIKEVMRMYAASPEVSRRALPADPRGAHAAGARRSPRWPATSGCSPAICWATSTSATHHDGNDDPLLAEVAASAVVTAHNHVLRRWLRAGGKGDVETQLDHAFAIVRDDLRHGHRRGPDRGGERAPGGPAAAVGGAGGRGAGDGGPYGRAAGRGHAHDRAGAAGLSACGWSSGRATDHGANPGSTPPELRARPAPRVPAIGHLTIAAGQGAGRGTRAKASAR